MGRTVDWDAVPDSTLLPQDIYEAMVESITEKQSQKGRLMYETVFRIVGGAFDGTPLYERYSVGTEADPNGDEQETWKTSIGVRMLKRMLRATGVTLSNDVDEACTAATGQHLTLTVDIEVDDGSKDAKYKGRQRNRIAAYYPMGEREVKTATAAAPPKAPLATAMSKAPKSAPKVLMSSCNVCKKSMPRDQLLNHIQTEHASDEE